MRPHSCCSTLAVSKPSRNSAVTAYSLGTGQIHEALAPMHEVSGVLNCLHDLEWILITNHTTPPERNKPNANI